MAPCSGSSTFGDRITKKEVRSLCGEAVTFSDSTLLSLFSKQLSPDIGRTETYEGGARCLRARLAPGLEAGLRPSPTPRLRPPWEAKAPHTVGAPSHSETRCPTPPAGHCRQERAGPRHRASPARGTAGPGHGSRQSASHSRVTGLTSSLHGQLQPDRTVKFKRGQRRAGRVAR